VALVGIWNWIHGLRVHMSNCCSRACPRDTSPAQGLLRASAVRVAQVDDVLHTLVEERDGLHTTTQSAQP
jgi:hypothetical protein